MNKTPANILRRRMTNTCRLRRPDILGLFRGDDHDGLRRRCKGIGQAFAGWGALFLVLCFWTAGVTGIPPSVWAGAENSTGPAGGNAAQMISEAEITEKLKNLEKRIEISVVAENEQTAGQKGLTQADLSERTNKLRAVHSAYERLLTALKKKASQQGEEALLREKLQAEKQTGIIQEPPYTLSFYDSILDDLRAAAQQKETAGLAAALSRKALEDVTLRFEKAQKEWRGLKDELDAVPGKETRRKLEWEWGGAEVETELAKALITVETVNRDNLLHQVKIAELRADLEERKLNWVRANLHFDETDLKKQLDAISARRSDFEKRVGKLIRKQNEAQAAWLTAQERLKRADKDKPNPVAEATFRAREAWLKSYQAALEQTEDMLRQLGHQEGLWKLRYGLVKGEVRHEDLVMHSQEIENHLASVNRMMSVQQSSQTNLQSQIIALEKKLSEDGLESAVAGHVSHQKKAVQYSVEGGLEYISSLLATEELDRRVIHEIDFRLERFDLKEKVRDVGGWIGKVWDFEVWVIDNHAVTVKKLLVALFILVIGILAAKYFLRAISRRLLAFTQLKETTASAILKMLTFSAYLLVLLFAMRMVNLPLGAFAFLGGAVAIGVGFGAQNLINNFISGFIMMAERPISIGDLIEVEGSLGKVEDIGARCTRVRTGENIRILVPNSSFLEKNITNWTISDKKIRAKIQVGVIYGSPVQEVKRLLLQVVGESQKVLKDPEPFVLFCDFGDNSLVFEVHFWIVVHKILDRRLIESSVRFRIDAVFRDAGIVIAFPQRDVHLDAHKPLEFRLLRDDEGA
ncbi:MAG: mechanosensitive ion channel [Deltaproteobacteria bacterium]|nr:mechanosensitive ion channel [Deltaproteobacteria bacterium]